MKIAIQGHPIRGKEVIQILESLEGKNTHNYKGENYLGYYSIVNNNIEYFNNAIWIENTKLYTLEEFEKEFPFKVGDKVIHKEFNDFFEVISFDPESSYPYKIKGVCEFNTKSYVLTKWYPKMKEERFVTLTLDKAKEWYSKGGELREIALQAFTKDELNPLPRSWEEYCRKYEYTCLSTRYTNIPLKYDALLKLEQLRDCWRQGWVPSKGDSGFGIRFDFYEGFRIVRLYSFSAFLSFPTEEMAKEFLKCFRDLIEKAGDLI